jgi:ABC-type Fe3+ transport system permease subunit
MNTILAIPALVLALSWLICTQVIDRWRWGR